MLKKLVVKNFKALVNVEINFTPLSVIIGGNSCGKTTVLQAIDFLRSSAIRDIPEYLNEKHWSFKELKSQINDGQNNPIEFIAIFEIPFGKEKKTLEWTFIVDQQNNHWEIREKIINLANNEELFSRGFDEGPMAAEGSNTSQAASAHAVSDILLEASWLKFVQKVSDKPEISALKHYLSSSVFFGVLSPDTIRDGNNISATENIGRAGISLAPFIHSMPEGQRKKLDRAISDYIDFTVQVKTIDLGGHIELYIEESFGGATTRINKDHISDGLLRIIAFVAIALEKIETPKGMILLDEIEDGINPYLTEKITGLLDSISQNAERQVIVTTHSPILLNAIKPENIVFLWKDKNGAIHGKSMFDTEEMRRTLKVLNPGEVWVNYEKEEILARLNPKGSQEAFGQ